MVGNGLNIKKIAMNGCGSTGGGMAQLFAEKGIHVSLSDPSEQAMDAAIKAAKTSNIPENMISKHTDYESLCKKSRRNQSLRVESAPWISWRQRVGRVDAVFGKGRCDY